MHDGSRLTLIETSPTGTEQQGATRPRTRERRPTHTRPDGQRALGRHSERHDAFTIALAEDPDHPSVPVDVVDVQTAEFPHSDAGGVEHLDDQVVPQRERVLLLRAEGRRGQGLGGFPRPQHSRQRSMRGRCRERRTRIGLDDLGLGEPRGEGPHRTHSTGDRGAGRPARDVGEPGPQRSAGQHLVEFTVGVRVQEGEERLDVGEVRPDGVRRSPASVGQVIGEPRQQAGFRPRRPRGPSSTCGILLRCGHGASIPKWRPTPRERHAHGARRGGCGA